MANKTDANTRRAIADHSNDRRHTGSEAARISPLMETIAQHSAVAYDLELQLEALRDKLCPVMSGITPARPDEEYQGDMSVSPAIAQINYATYKLRSMIVKISDISAALEV